MSLAWSDEYSVGHDVLDGQHQTILLLIGDLEILVSEADKKTSKIKSLLNDLTNYASEHFETEEKILSSVQFGDALAHKQEHDQYTEYVAVQLALALQNESRLEDLQRFLRAWWSEHILIEDKKYKPYIELAL